MTVDIRDAEFLKLRLSREDNERLPISFLLGSPFSLDNGLGVPNIDGFIDIVRQRVASSGAAFSDDLNKQLAGSSGSQRYQTAMGFVYDALDANAAADVVKAAVLRARRPEAPPLDPNSDYDGDPKDWSLTRAQRDLARMMRRDPDRFSGPVFTTNFDPMIELAVRAEGFFAKTMAIPLDGSTNAPVKSSRSEIDIFHLHGYWRDSATLHRPQQLRAPRPQLQHSLQRHLDNTHLIVMAYSGWDDIFTDAIANCLRDPGFRGTISWCFYNPDPIAAQVEHSGIFSKFADGIAQGRISFFCGIDCHRFFGEMLGSPMFGTVDHMAVDAPFPGWQCVTPSMLDALPALSGAEAVHFFDGAVPTLRHAISPLVPSLGHTETLKMRLTNGAEGGCGMQLLRAAGGEGKSTALLQAAAHAARGGEWNVLWRPTADAGLAPEMVAQLDPSKRWLIVADDADGLIADIWAAAQIVHPRGAPTVFFLLAARDTDWRRRGGDATAWSTRLNKFDDLVLGHLGRPDAALVVDAWTAQGDQGLRALKAVRTRTERIARLVGATRATRVRDPDGSFFGGLLDTRFGATGLVDHLLPLLASLRDRAVAGGTVTLYDALLFIANCHATGMPGLDKRILAELCGIPVYRVTSAIVTPLGRELGAAESRGAILTRHKRVAEAILIAANRLDTDLCATWVRIVTATVAVSRRENVGETFSPIVHAGARLKRDLPQALDAELRGEIGIATAQVAMTARPERMSQITDLARAFRFADHPREACELLKSKVNGLAKLVDKAQGVRPYFFEWSACAGSLGDRGGAIMDVWLAACSLSDAFRVDLPVEQAKLSCAGLGVAFERLVGGKPDGAYSRGWRAVTMLGWQSNPDARASRYFSRYDRELRRLGTANPVDNDEAIAWLTDAAYAAWQELTDVSVRNLKNDGRLTFARLGQIVKTS